MRQRLSTPHRRALKDGSFTLDLLTVAPTHRHRISRKRSEWLWNSEGLTSAHVYLHYAWKHKNMHANIRAHTEAP